MALLEKGLRREGDESRVFMVIQFLSIQNDSIIHNPLIYNTEFLRTNNIQLFSHRISIDLAFLPSIGLSMSKLNHLYALSIQLLELSLVLGCIDAQAINRVRELSWPSVCAPMHDSAHLIERPVAP